MATMETREIVVLGASALLGIGGTAMLTVFSAHSTAVAVASGVAIFLAIVGFVWALWLAPKSSRDDDAAIKVKRLGKGVIEGNRTHSRTLYSGEEADELSIRENIVGGPRPGGRSKPNGVGHAKRDGD